MKLLSLGALVCLLTCCATTVSGTSFGAGACFVSQEADMSLFKSNHAGPDQANSDGGFYLATSSTSWRRGCGIRVSLCPRASSNRYKGVLLYSQQTKSAAAVRVGAFAGTTSDKGSASWFQTKNCGGSAAATITHTDVQPKQNLQTVWTPDATTDDGTNVQLGMIYVRSSQSDWYVSSLTLTPAAASTAACPAVPASACSAVCDDMQGMEDMCPASDYGGAGQGPFFDEAAGVFISGDHTGHDHPTTKPTSSSGGHNHGDMDMGDMHSMSGHSMTMGVFSTQWQSVTILFKQWTLDDSQIYVVSMAGIFLLAFAVHALTAFHHYLDRVLLAHNDAKSGGVTLAPHPNRLIRLIVDITAMPVATYAISNAALKAATMPTAEGVEMVAPAASSSCCTPNTDASSTGSADAASMSKAKDVSVSVLESSSSNAVIVAGGCVYNSRQHIFRTSLHAVRFFLSYCIMIIFMTMDVGVIMALIGGVAAGYYVFDNQCVDTYSGCNPPSKSADCHDHHV